MGGPTRGGGVDGKTRTVEFQKHMGIRADIGGDRGWSEVIRGDQGRSGEIRGDRRRSEESRAAGCRGRTAPVRVAVVLRPKVAPRGLGVGRARGQGPLRAAALVRPRGSPSGGTRRSFALCRNTCRTVPTPEPKCRKRKEEKGAHVGYIHRDFMTVH